MPDKKCPMCDGMCILKMIATKSSDAEAVDVCSACGAMYQRGKEGERDKDAENADPGS